MPSEVLGNHNPGMGFGLGSRVMLDVAATRGPGSVGEGAAKTCYWVDPREELVGLFMTQYMTGVQSPEPTCARSPTKPSSTEPRYVRVAPTSHPRKSSDDRNSRHIRGSHEQGARNTAGPDR